MAEEKKLATYDFEKEFQDHKTYSFSFSKIEEDEELEIEVKKTYVFYFSSKEDAEEVYKLFEPTEKLISNIVEDVFKSKPMDFYDPWLLNEVQEGYDSDDNCYVILDEHNDPFKDKIEALGLPMTRAQHAQFDSKHQYLIQLISEDLW